MVITLDSGAHDGLQDYHQFVPPPGHPRVQGLDSVDIYSYSEGILKSEHVKQIFDEWMRLLRQPFYGITNDGCQKTGLFQLADEGLPTSEIVEAVELVLDSLSSVERKKATADLDSGQWRQWSNPEMLICPAGVRLEHLTQTQIDLIWALLKKSLSEEGFAKVQGATSTNRFLGELCNARPILNENSYFFIVFGRPSLKEPWAYTFFGHHLCLNFFICRRQMTLSPFFIGAEPNIIDHGPLMGLEVLNKEGEAGLALMQSLSPELQACAQIYKQMHDPAMPPGRWNPADQRHLAGAFQDNRVIPYEGVRVTEMTVLQQESLMRIVAIFYVLLPKESLRARLDHVRRYLEETYFSWIGGYGTSDAFYYRIQSPVVLLEFDHHSGVFLLNKEPAKYHIHTIARTPNGNDYGRELLKLYRGRQAMRVGEGVIKNSQIRCQTGTHEK